LIVQRRSSQLKPTAGWSRTPWFTVVVTNEQPRPESRGRVLLPDVCVQFIYLNEEVARFCDVYFKPKQKQSPLDHQAMNAALDPAVSRFTSRQDENADEAELSRGKLQAFLNLYGFLSQVIPYQDSDLERLYVFLRHLAAKLPRRAVGAAYQFDDEVKLEYYRLQKISEGSISLKDGEAQKLDGPSEVGSGLLREQPVALSQLIDVINERFGTDFNQADQLFFDQIVEEAMSDEALRQAATVNPGDKFELLFKNVLENLFVDRMDQNEDIFVKFMNDLPFKKVVTTWMADEAYRRLRLSATDKGGPPAVSLRRVVPLPKDRYVNCVPLVALKAAAGAFGDPQHVEDGEFEWVAVDARRKLRPGMFVAQVVGKSMEPAIPDGAFCLFSAPVTGTRAGKTVLVQLRNAVDPETGHQYTVKRYESEKAPDGDSWKHTKVTLKPVNPRFEPIVLTDTNEDQVQVIAEFVEVVAEPCEQAP
jgi:type I restriction enzyme R subunit